MKVALGLADESIHYDDDWFYSVLVSMGSLGIIYSLIVEVDAQYDLVDNREQVEWGAMQARLRSMSNALSGDPTASGGPGGSFVPPGGGGIRVDTGTGAGAVSPGSADPFAHCRGLQVIFNPYPARDGRAFAT